MNKSLTLLLFLCALGHIVSGQASWQKTNGPEGGTVYALATQGPAVYACGSEGLWKSLDQGAHWQRTEVTTDKEVCVALSVDGNEMLLIGYEVVDAYDYPASIYRSTDGGQNWQKNALNFDVEWSLDWGPPKVWREGNTIWYKSATNEFMKSTNDGLSWAALNKPTLDANDYLRELAVSGDKALAYTSDKTYRSADGGASWQEVGPGIGYVSSLYSDGDLILKIVGDSILRSDDFGYSWVGDSTGLYELSSIFRTQDGRFALPNSQLLLSTDGLHWQTLTQDYASIQNGVDLGGSFLLGGSHGIYRTVQNNTALETANTGFVASTIYALAATPNGRLVAGARNGVFLSHISGQSWQPLSPNAAYYPPNFLTLATKDNDVWAVAGNDSLYVLRENANTWERVIDADGWFSGESFVRVIEDELFLVEDAQIRRSLDNGMSWQPFLTGSGSDGLRDIAKIGDIYFYVDNNGVVHRSNDGGLSWQTVQETWSPGAHNKHVLPVVGNRLFHFERDEAYFTDDLGATWQALGLTGLPADSWGDPIFDFSSFTLFQNAMLVTLPPYGVYISFNQGNAWESLNAGLSNGYGYAIATRGNTLYYGGSRTGVWSLNSQFEIFSGKVFNDLNDNGTQDAGENGLENTLVSAEPLGSLTQTGAGGNYSVVAASQLDSIKVSLPNKYATAHPSAYLAAQTGGGYDFALHFIPNVIDLKVDLVHWQPFRPGFTNHLTLTVENVGTAAALSAVATCQLPAGLENAYAFAPVGTSVSIQGDSVIWQIDALQPGETVALDISVQVGADIVIGTEFIIFSSVAVSNDAEADNDQFRLITTVLGSYDPNDKQAAALISPDDVAAGKPIEYTIRFENTGTFYAEKVVITDALEDNLDPATFRFISSSHPCTWTVKNYGVVEFVFQDIFLFSQEGGFVKFSVEADHDLPLHETIANTADIVFDFNSPIATNTVTTTVQYPVWTKDPGTLSYNLRISPNPATSWARIELPPDAAEMADKMAAFDELGREIWSINLPANSVRLDVSSFASGVFDLRLFGKSGETLASGKLVVAH